MVSPYKICFCGDGHGAVAAMRSLVKTFNKVKVVSKDLGVQSQLRQSDLRLSDQESAEGNVIICAGYGKLNISKILNRNVVINTYPSLLPKHRGIHAFIHSLVWAMLNKEHELGFSIH